MHGHLNVKFLDNSLLINQPIIHAKQSEICETSLNKTRMMQYASIKTRGQKIINSECMTSGKTNKVQTSLYKNRNSDSRYKLTVPAFCSVV